jgi:hypothetical protein
VVSLYTESKTIQTEIQQVIRDLDQGTKTQSLRKLARLKKEVERINVAIEETRELNKIYEDANKHLQRCIGYNERQQELTQSSLIED